MSGFRRERLMQPARDGARRRFAPREAAINGTA